MIRKIMKIFSNLFGNNSKISWKDIACNISSKSGNTLDKFITQPNMIICTSTNENPQSKYGGTWELIDKEFKSQYITTSDKDYVTKSNCSTFKVWASLAGHTANIAIHINPSVTVADSTIEYGKIDWERIGFSKPSISYKGFIATADGGNGIIMIEIDNTGAIRSIDVVCKTSGGSIASGNEFRCDTTITLSYSQMLDSYCNKFYWKKISN